MRRPARLLLCLSLLSAALSASLAVAQTPVRVLLRERAPEVRLDIAGPHTVTTVRGAVDSATGFDWPLEVRGNELYSAGLPVGSWIQLTPQEGVVSYEDASYRGALRLEAVDGSIRVINILDLEAYLRGVVPAEMQANWPMEALKAQAVAARSYTIYNLAPDEPYDICATTDCQVYRGIAGEHPRSNEAVAATEGRIMTWGGEVVRAHYHADSGGTTASSAEVWGYNLPYLQPRNDQGVSSPHRGWSARLSPNALARALQNEGRSVGTPSELSILEWSASGRAYRAAVRGSAGSVTLSGPSLTRVLRGAGLKSTAIEMVGPLDVWGAGWGHGVGMSQWGARSLALQGSSYSQILAHYYVGVTFDQVPTVVAAR